MGVVESGWDLMSSDSCFIMYLSIFLCNVCTVGRKILLMAPFQREKWGSENLSHFPTHRAWLKTKKKKNHSDKRNLSIIFHSPSSSHVKWFLGFLRLWYSLVPGCLAEFSKCQSCLGHPSAQTHPASHAAQGSAAGHLLSKAETRRPNSPSILSSGWNADKPKKRANGRPSRRQLLPYSCTRPPATRWRDHPTHPGCLPV